MLENVNHSLPQEASNRSRDEMGSKIDDLPRNTMTLPHNIFENACQLPSSETNNNTTKSNNITLLNQSSQQFSAQSVTPSERDTRKRPLSNRDDETSANILKMFSSCLQSTILEHLEVHIKEEILTPVKKKKKKNTKVPIPIKIKVEEGEPYQKVGKNLFLSNKTYLKTN